MRRFILAFFFVFLIALKANAQLDTEHYFAPMHATSSGGFIPINGDGGSQYLYLATPSTTPFTVTITDGAGNALATATISNTSPFEYAVGTGQSSTTEMFVMQDQLNTPLTGRGLIIKGPNAFTASFKTSMAAHAELMTSKGKAAKGRTFRAGGIPIGTTGTDKGFFTSFMATEPGTTTITVSGYNPAVEFDGTPVVTADNLTITLQQGQTYVVSGTSTIAANTDGFLGALITSDKDIIVEHGAVLGSVAVNGIGQDAYFDQSAPIERVGQDYILINGGGDTSMEIPIVIAHTDNTQIFVNGSTTPIATLNAGQYYKVPNNNYIGVNMYIKTSQPSYVFQALSGGAQTNGGMMFIPPFNCYLPHQINIPKADGIGSTSYTATAMLFTQQGSVVKYNGTVQTGGTLVAGTQWESYKFNIAGNAELTSTGAMSASLYGVSGTASYAGTYAGFSEIPDKSQITYADTCLNSNTTFGSIHNVDSTITGFNWNFGDPGTGAANTSTLENPTHVFSAAGNYNVQLIILRTTCNDTVNKTLTIISSTTATISGPTGACLNAPQPVITLTGLNGTAPYTFTYKINNGTPTTISSGAGNSATLNAPTNVAGTFKYYLTAVQDASGPTTCGSISDSITITISADLPISVNSASLCYGESATLTASGANTYSWAPATGLNATTGASVISTPPSTVTSITYTVTGTSGSCVGTGTTTVTYNPTPDSEAGADITLCSGTTGTIGAPTTAGYVYSWSPATGLNSTTVADPTVNTTNFTASPITTTYTVTTSPAGCFSTDEVTVTINPSFDPAFNYASSTFCKSGGGANPSPTIVSAGGTFTFAPTGLSINGSSGLIDLSLSNLGTYTVTYSIGGACPSSSAQTVTITNIPDASFSYGTYCQNVTPNPTPLFPTGASAGVFTANSPGLVFVSGFTPGEVDLTASAPGTYTITNTIAAGGGCPNAVATNTITINPIPVISVNAPTICAGGSATLSASGATSYVWSDASTANSLSDSPATTTPYSVTGTSAGCSAITTTSITVNALPVVSVNDATICAGSSATLIASGATNYSWSDGTLTNTLTDTPVTLTNYTVTGTTLGCSASAIAIVTVNQLPFVTVNDATVCAGLPATLTASGANTYLWSTAETTSSINVSPNTTTPYTVIGTAAGCTGSAISTVTVNNSPNVTVNSTTICLGTSTTLTAQGANSYSWSDGTTGNSITISPISNSSYTVTGTSANCPATAIATVTVNDPVIVSVNAATICEGQTAVLTGSGATTYLWSTGSVTNQISVSPTSNASYTVTGNPTGCAGSAIANVTVNPLPTIAVNTTSICFGFSSTLTASGANSYVWSTGSITNSTTVSPSIPTTYTVTGTNGFGCINTATGTVTVFPKPNAQFNANPNPAKMLSPLVNFTDISSPDVSNWFWDFGDGDSLTTSSQNISHTYPSDTATYTVTLIVHNDGLCYDTIVHYVQVGPEFAFYIPNAFSPNDDQKNDVFFGTGSGISEYQITIFDRWGNFIFFSDDINTAWDGKANKGSDIVLQDTYVWKVEILDVLKKKHSYIGTVTISK